MIRPRKHLKNIYRASNRDPSRLFKLRLDRNERNQAFTPGFVDRVRNRITDELFMTYPEPALIYDKLASWLEVDSQNLLIHFGSDQAIKAVYETYIEPGDKVLLHLPGFAMYEVYCQMFQAEVLTEKYNHLLKFSWESFINKIVPGLRMVVVENPNGFLGLPVSLKTVRSILERSRQCGAFVLVDEAYYHFHQESVISWIEEFENLIISRTFSKAMGLAGLRVGYLISRPENIANLMKVRPAYEIISLTAIVVDELLAHPEEMEKYVEETKRNLSHLKKSLSHIGIESSDSKANFVTARIGPIEVHDALRNTLQAKDILIRPPFREPELREWVRISTAPIQVQMILLQDLELILKQHRKEP